MSQDLGFSYREREGEYQIFHKGRLATTLRGNKAIQFEALVIEADFDRLQQTMARLTGNYKRGNERHAREHPRNSG